MHEIKSSFETCHDMTRNGFIGHNDVIKSHGDLSTYLGLENRDASRRIQVKGPMFGVIQ